MKVSLLKAFVAVVISLYGAYLCVTGFGVGKLAQSINDFHKKVQFNACLKYKSALKCREEVYD